VTIQTPHGREITITHNERPGVSDPFHAQPRDEALSDAFGRQPIDVEPAPPAPVSQSADPAAPAYDVPTPMQASMPYQGLATPALDAATRNTRLLLWIGVPLSYLITTSQP
jgi:hypothetical protein